MDESLSCVIDNKETKSDNLSPGEISIGCDLNTYPNRLISLNGDYSHILRNVNVVNNVVRATYDEIIDNDKNLVIPMSQETCEIG